MKNIFAKKETAEVAAATRFSRKTLYKHGGYSIALTAIAIVVVVLINLLFAALGNRVSLKVDLSFTGENSISEENAEFIKSIDKEVSLSVCATKEDYEGGYMDLYAKQYFGVYDKGGYYAQTVRLIDLYNEMNSNITVEYLDLGSTAGSAIISEFPSISYGDIIVRYTNSDGNATSKVVGFDDIYSYENASGYGYYYTITANKLETALSSAINSCISGKSKTAALLKSCSESDIFDALFGSNLKLNNFEITEITDNVITNIPNDIDQLYIVYPTRDLLPDELLVINNWLYNEGNRGKSLIFIPGTSVANIPNLTEFLTEWGISYTDGILYETNSSNHAASSPTTLAAFNNQTDLDGILNSSKYFFLGNNLPMEATYETHSTKTTNVMVSTSDTVVAAPLGIDETEWKPTSDYDQKSYANLIITKDSDVVGDSLKTSYVAAFSSFDFIYSQWAQYSHLANMDTALNTASYIAGFDTDNQLLFIDKTATVESFADQISKKGVAIILIIFMVIVPIVLVATGIVIWLRRRNR